MRILFLTSQFPYPPHGGGALRAYGLMQGVARAGYQIALFSFAASPPDSSPLHEWCTNIQTLPPPSRRLSDRLRDLLLTSKADMARRFWSDEAATVLRSILKEDHFDIVHAESIEMAVYLSLIHEWYPDLPLVYGSLNAEADLQRTMFSLDRRNPRRLIGAVYSWIQWRRLTQLESHLCDISAYVLAVSELDRDLLAAMSDTPVQVVKNGIDTAQYTHLTQTDDLGDYALVFTGTMDYRPNVDAVLWFTESIFPQILKQHSDTHFYIVGHRPHKRLAHLDEHPNITLTGRVDEIAPYWQGAKVYIAPLRMGSGTRFKLLEAMAAGCAVVSTTLGAQGLNVQSGRECLIADSAADFAAATNSLLSNPDRRQQLGQTGREFVRQNFDWTVIVPHLLEVYEKIGNID